MHDVSHARILALRKEYDAALSKGNVLLKAKKYLEAKVEFEKASALIPDEKEPAKKLAEIAKAEERIAAEKEKNENEAEGKSSKNGPKARPVLGGPK